jgi:glyoxylase-like metal-dependent hydrolase (beta-lactamase superfamily II)
VPDAGGGTRPTGSYRFAVGDLACWVFDDGDYAMPAPFLAVNAPPAELAASVAALGQPMDAFATTMNNLLVRTGDQLVLVDTGFGAYSPETGKLLPALAAAGFAPEDIDVVLLTHLHADHFAGALDADGEPVFPRARYLIDRSEYAFWSDEPDLAELPLPDAFKQTFRQGAKGVLTGLGGKIEQIEPGTEIAPGITVLAAAGHTPGHLAVELGSGGETLLHVVDAAADPVLGLQHPDWFIAPDLWPAQALATRRALFDRAAEERLLVLAYHFAFPGLGHVTADGDDWLWEPIA